MDSHLSFFAQTIFSTNFIQPQTIKHMKQFSLLFISFIAFTKLSLAQTACQWAYIPVAASSYNYAIAGSTTDANGNIIQVGKIAGVADMDPGPGASEVSLSNPGGNYFLSKTSHTGHLIWIKYFTSPTYISFFDFKGVQVNTNNEIIVLGNFYGLVDFDLSPTGLDTLRSHFGTYPDYFLAKYDSSGNKIWVFNIGINSPNNIESHAMSLLPNNTILVAANPTSSAVDVDPSPAIHNSIGGNANLICYSNNGTYLWNNNIPSTTSLVSTYRCLDADSAQNSYMMSVSSYELTVNKFSSAGARIWSKKIGLFPSSRVTPYSILTDKMNGSFYIAGTYRGTVDFDPGSVVVNLSGSSGTFEDGFLAKYDSSMNLLWVKNFAGNLIYGKYCLDFSGNDIVAVGRLNGSINFGNGVTLSSTSGVSNPFFIKCNSSGTTLNGYVLNGNGGYNSINCNSNQSYHTSGYVSGTCDMDPTAGVASITSGLSTTYTAAYGTLPVLSSGLQVKLYLQGYYISGGLMQSVLLNQGITSPSNITDSITVELHSTTPPYSLVRSSTVLLNTNGTATCTYTPLLSGSYYIAIKHRNSITTWSSTPVNIGASLATYDFTNSSTKAYGNNMIEMGPGKWALYTGEINQDDNIDLVDSQLLETAISNFAFGYEKADFNGDGNVDLLDIAIIEEGINEFIFSMHP